MPDALPLHGLPPLRIRLSRIKGWRLPPDAVNVARPGRWGNPFRVDVFGRERAIALFGNALHGVWTPGLFEAGEADDLVLEAHAAHEALQRRQPLVDAARAQLRGKDLACWCQLDEACHADVLLRIANE